MPLTGGSYGQVDERVAIETIQHAIDVGMNLLDTAEVYGPYTNEELVGRAIAGRRDQAVVSTKCGSYIDTKLGRSFQDSRPERIRQSCDESLRRLGVDVIDLYYQHRVDSTVPIEESWGAMADLVQNGKVRYLGMSEPGLRSLRRAHAVHPVTVIENEYSLFTRDPEGEVLETARELGIGLVAYAPLARGLLSRELRQASELSTQDMRAHHPRFQGQDFAANLELAEQVDRVAQAKGITPAQLALAWLLSRGPDIVPIPGVKGPSLVDDNARAAEVELTEEDLKTLDSIAPQGGHGARYQAIDTHIGAESPEIASS